MNIGNEKRSGQSAMNRSKKAGMAKKTIIVFIGRFNSLLCSEGGQ
jgi:hypothetical protein